MNQGRVLNPDTDGRMRQREPGLCMTCGQPYSPLRKKLCKSCSDKASYPIRRAQRLAQMRVAYRNRKEVK